MPYLGLSTGLSERNLILDVCDACCVCEIEVHERGGGGGWRGKVNAVAGPRGVRKNKRNRMIKELRSLDIRARSLDMKYYLVTGGLSSVHQLPNNSNYKAFMLGVHVLRSFLKLICEYELHSLPNKKLVAQRIMVKTASRSNRSWSAIFCVIVYYKRLDRHCNTLVCLKRRFFSLPR